jgi:hypothetical protein
MINADLAFDRRCGVRSAVLAQWFEGAPAHTGLLEAPAPLPDNTRVRTKLKAFAIVLLLGGIGHSGGIAYFYATTGVPEANLVLLDLWVAEVHLLAGGLYLAASSRAIDGTAMRLLAAFGALYSRGIRDANAAGAIRACPGRFSNPALGVPRCESSRACLAGSWARRLAGQSCGRARWPVVTLLSIPIRPIVGPHPEMRAWHPCDAGAKAERRPDRNRAPAESGAHTRTR